MDVIIIGGALATSFAGAMFLQKFVLRALLRTVFRP